MSGPLDSPLSLDRLRGSEACAVRLEHREGLEIARAPHAGHPKREIVEPTYLRRH